MMKQLKILIIDDEKIVRESLEMTLEKEGYDLHFANNGKQGLEIIAAIRPAIIILDLRMPEMTGNELLSKMESINVDPKSIIVISGHATNSDIKQCYNAGITTFISKPFNTHILRGTIANLIQLLNYEKNLEDTVAERTADLQKTNNKISALNEESQLFLKYLSHEMRTPLNWISGGTQLLSYNISESDKETLRMIISGFERLLQLNDDFLSYSQFSNSELKLNITNVSVLKNINYIIAEKQSKFTLAQLKITVNIADIISIQADPSYFDQLIKIIIDNAINFSEKNSTITISAETIGKNVFIKVSDKGKGINKESIKNIFTPFKIESFDRHIDGFGLNLPKTKIIADAHGWKIWAESEGNGKGATFVLKI